MNHTIEEKERIAFVNGDLQFMQFFNDFHMDDGQQEQQDFRDMLDTMHEALNSYWKKESTPRQTIKIIRDAMLMYAPLDWNAS